MKTGLQDFVGPRYASVYWNIQNLKIASNKFSSDQLHQKNRK
jgi:hypothetical protein